MNSAQAQQRRRPTGTKDNNSPRHLDNSNVLYDLDFEIDEDKVNFWFNEVVIISKNVKHETKNRFKTDIYFSKVSVF